MVKDVKFGADGITFISITGKNVTVPVNYGFVRTGKL